MTTEGTLLVSIAGAVFGAAIMIIAYFLKDTMSRLKRVEQVSDDTKHSHDLLKLDHNNKHETMSDKFDDLKDSIVILTREIKELTSQIRK